MSKNDRIATRVISMILGVLMGVALVILGSVVKAETLVWLALVVWGVIVIIGKSPLSSIPSPTSRPRAPSST